MGGLIQTGGRAFRYLRTYGPVRLYRKVKERQMRNRAERGYEEWLIAELPDEQQDRRQRETQFAFQAVSASLSRHTRLRSRICGR